MLYISKNKNPYSQDGDLVDLEKLHVCGPHIQRYWIPSENRWYSRKGSIYDSVFYKTDPYNGILDYGLSIFNNNKSWDREVHDIWMFLALVDLKNPTIQSEYTEINPETGGLRIFLRFNEPVYSCRKDNSFLTVNLNNDKINKYYANYVEGNYTDTLVYEVPADNVPKTLIERVDYTLPSDDIGDLAFNLDVYRRIQPYLRDQQLLLVINKIDLIPSDTLHANLPLLQQALDEAGLHSSPFKGDRGGLLFLSAKHSLGFDHLREVLVRATRLPQAQGDVILTNHRHYEAMQEAHQALLHVIDGLESHLSSDLVAEDLHAVIDALNSVLGRSITSQDTLNNIFKNFCIGK
jgi:hypothetical protein